MNDTLKILTNIFGGNDGSFIEKIKLEYRNNSFTEKQKKAAELFLFEPTKENAIKALTLTPKAYIFLKNFLDEETIVKIIIALIEGKEINRIYLKTLFTFEPLKPIRDKVLRKSQCKQIKTFLMEMSLRGKPIRY